MTSNGRNENYTFEIPVYTKRTRHKCNHINNVKYLSFLLFSIIAMHTEMKWKPQISTKLFISMLSVIADIPKKLHKDKDRESDLYQMYKYQA